MPELPEVETTRRGLEPVLSGATIRNVEARRPDLRYPLPAHFSERLSGRRIVKLDRLAKYLLARLDDDNVLVIHLGMSGRFIVEDRDTVAARHDHVIFELENETRVIFRDPRRFGLMDLVPDSGLVSHRYFRDLGPDPLTNGFNEESLRDSLAGRRTPIKAALLDQRIVAGLGNIYACEALFRARISPRRTARTIGAVRASRLVPAIRAVLSEAIDAGGSSLRDYARVDGALGYFQHRFSVYGKEGAACPVPECSGMIRRIVQAGRSSFYCPAHQR